jgi:hypothetical protein
MKFENIKTSVLKQLKINSDIEYNFLDGLTVDPYHTAEDMKLIRLRREANDKDYEKICKELNRRDRRADGNT